MAQNEEGPTSLARNRYPAGVPCWVDTSQRDPEAAMRFYGGLFGWEFEDRMPPDAPGRYLVARLHGLDVAGLAYQPDDEPSWNTFICVDSAERATAQARDAGAAVVVEPFEVSGAGRMAVLADPTGAVFCVWQATGHHGAQLVNAPGAWNWSDLYTPDPKRAEPFYGAVFGWKTTDVDFGDAGSVTMWRRPGYGDALEALDPGIRDRHAEAGAPEGFTDAVGWLIRDDGPSRWHVTFSVDDTDAAVERATKLGAEVLTPAYDAGPVRLAVLRDPQGAVFAVSRYDPS
jgi:uncharacterized protein